VRPLLAREARRIEDCCIGLGKDAAAGTDVAKGFADLEREVLGAVGYSSCRLCQHWRPGGQRFPRYCEPTLDQRLALRESGLCRDAEACDARVAAREASIRARQAVDS